MNHHANVEQAYHIRPDKFVLSTESSNCPGVASDPALAWYRAQRYAHDIISDLNHFAAGWVDWNLILDTNGGPNHLNNTCDAPILITSDRRIKIQPMYYFIQHFSKFIPPGSTRVHVDMQAHYREPGETTLSDAYPGNLHACESRYVCSRKGLHYPRLSLMKIRVSEYLNILLVLDKCGTFRPICVYKWTRPTFV